MDIDAVVATTQVVEQADGEIADTGSDVEQTMLGEQPATDDFGSDRLAHLCEDVGLGAAVVVDAQVRGGEQFVTSPSNDPLHG
jgi:hypothetical protein